MPPDAALSFIRKQLGQEEFRLKEGSRRPLAFKPQRTKHLDKVWDEAMRTRRFVLECKADGWWGHLKFFIKEGQPSVEIRTRGGGRFRGSGMLESKAQQIMPRQLFELGIEVYGEITPLYKGQELGHSMLSETKDFIEKGKEGGAGGFDLVFKAFSCEQIGEGPNAICGSQLGSHKTELDLLRSIFHETGPFQVVQYHDLMISDQGLVVYGSQPGDIPEFRAGISPDIFIQFCLREAARRTIEGWVLNVESTPHKFVRDYLGVVRASYSVKIKPELDFTFAVNHAGRLFAKNHYDELEAVGFLEQHNLGMLSHGLRTIASRCALGQCTVRVSYAWVTFTGDALVGQRLVERRAGYGGIIQHATVAEGLSAVDVLLSCCQRHPYWRNLRSRWAAARRAMRRPVPPFQNEYSPRKGDAIVYFDGVATADVRAGQCCASAYVPDGNNARVPLVSPLSTGIAKPANNDNLAFTPCQKISVQLLARELHRIPCARVRVPLCVWGRRGAFVECSKYLLFGLSAAERTTPSGPGSKALIATVAMPPGLHTVAWQGSAECGRRNSLCLSAEIACVWTSAGPKTAAQSQSAVAAQASKHGSTRANAGEGLSESAQRHSAYLEPFIAALPCGKEYVMNSCMDDHAAASCTDPPSAHFGPAEAHPASLNAGHVAVRDTAQRARTSPQKISPILAGRVKRRRVIGPPEGHRLQRAAAGGAHRPAACPAAAARLKLSSLFLHS